MNRDVGVFLVPLIALALFALILFETVGALRSTGVWSRPGVVAAAGPEDPLVALDRLVGLSSSATHDDMVRDPFGLSAPVITHSVSPTVRRPVEPVQPAGPQLTAIVFDADPRAIVHWQGRDWTIRPGGLFDDFQVVGITRDQVVLRRGDENIILTRKSQGE